MPNTIELESWSCKFMGSDMKCDFKGDLPSGARQFVGRRSCFVIRGSKSNFDECNIGRREENLKIEVIKGTITDSGVLI